VTTHDDVAAEVDTALSPLVEEVLEQRARAMDEHRVDELAKIKARGMLTARERIAALVDPDSFLELGPLAQPLNPAFTGAADGVVVGFGAVDGITVGLVSFDYSVFGGTQGPVGHAKIDKVLERCYEQRFPVVIFNEGGGTRVQEMQGMRPTHTFPLLSLLSGVVPVISVVLGRAFAGNANIPGLSNVIIASRTSALGLAGPPLVESALGMRLTPEEIGGIDMHAKSGAVDLVAEHDEDAVDQVRRLLGYFTGRSPAHREPGPPEALRDIVPENPRRAYDCRAVIDALVDESTAMELRAEFGRSVVTSLARLGGWTIAIVASQPKVMAGAIDADAAEKMAYFVKLADTLDVPILFLVDTPGFMVGPDAEKTALVRRGTRVVHALVHASVPLFTVQTRKAYGFAAFALGGSGLKPVLTLVWPTAEYGAMGLEGASMVIDREGDKATHVERAAEMRREIGAWQRATQYFADDLIDPAETRDRLMRALQLVMPGRVRTARKAMPDSW
jgi:acetyl-CoA carboxylase carboxyltransferase component